MLRASSIGLSVHMVHHAKVIVMLWFMCTVLYFSEARQLLSNFMVLWHEHLSILDLALKTKIKKLRGGGVAD